MDQVAAALDGSGPALAPLRASTRPDADAVPREVALVVTTSGSTGTPRSVMLDTDALVASATATHERLGGPGRWLLSLPLHHVAGLQVAVRSLLAGAPPAVAEGLDIAGLMRGASRPRYGSIVPTQLHRILAGDPRPWAELDAILVGGAATPPALLDRAREAGLRVVTTYGATETSGGCVYDGVPLAGVRVRIDDVVHLGGPTLARGYLHGDDPAFVTRDGERWFRTGDLGELRDGVLHVHGRADDVIISGGVNVAPAAVEAVLAGLPGVRESCVVGVPDPEWGQQVVAVVVGSPPPLTEVRDAVRRTLGVAAAPRRVVVVDALPLRGPGKVDRAAVARMNP